MENKIYTLIILDIEQLAVYYYNITEAQADDVELFMEERNHSTSYCNYMMVDTLTVFDNRHTK